MDDCVRLEVRDGVAHVTLNRPDAANTIDLAMARRLEEVALALAGDPGVRAVLLAGAGDRFCAGGDVRSFAATGDGIASHLREVTASLHVAVSLLVRLDAPVVAAVQGSAAGAGLGLVAASDLVVAGESARLVMAYTGVGLTPDGSSSWFLPRLVGLRRALDLTLTNRVLGATEAEAWGIVSRVVPDAAVHAEAEALASRLAAGPTLAFGGAKRLLHDALGSGLESHMARETAEIARVAAAADGREGLAAFAEKRPPVFRGA